MDRWKGLCAEDRACPSRHRSSLYGEASATMGFRSKPSAAYRSGLPGDHMVEKGSGHLESYRKERAKARLVCENGHAVVSHRTEGPSVNEGTHALGVQLVTQLQSVPGLDHPQGSGRTCFHCTIVADVVQFMRGLPN